MKSFHKWVSNIIIDKDILTPLIVERMVNEKDIYSLSLYQNFYAGTNLVPNVDDYKSEYYENGGGETALALITGCYCIEHNIISG